MFLLICIKSISLILISLEYHTRKIGANAEGWAISFYIFTLQASFLSLSLQLAAHTGVESSRLLTFVVVVDVVSFRGSVTFVILLLIGTGWVFVKPFLSARDKKIFMAVIPLQVFANIAQVVISETEQGANSWSYWNAVLISVDLFCYIMVLVPIIQTRQHLAQSQTEGKGILSPLFLPNHLFFFVVQTFFLLSLQPCS